jgi:serine/threonine protein kinase
VLLAGSNFGPYRILEPLGRGGMAAVYKAYEPGLDRYVALKVLPPDFLRDADFGERFRREARVIAKLEHPNIVPIYAFDIEEEIPWMSMRLVPGGALSALLAKGRLPESEILAILGGVAEALDYAHSQGVVHRDIKPQNVLLDPAHQHVYLADFGIAKMVEGSPGLTRTGMITGTPQYMAPEQATGKAVDHRADIYALGIVAYEMLTGHTPFTADTPIAILMKHVSEPIPLPDPNLIPELQMLALLKSLAKEPDERWASAGAFIAALRQGGEADASQPTRPATSLPTTGRTPQSQVPTRPAAAASAPPLPRPQRSSLPLILGLALVALLFAVSATVALVWWLGPKLTSVASDAATTPAPGPTATTPAGVPQEPATPSPTPTVIVLSPEPTIVRDVKPGPVAPTPERTGAPPDRARHHEAASLAPSTPQPLPPSLAPATPAPTPSSSHPPPPPPGLPFAVGGKIPLGNAVVGPITMLYTLFKTSPGQLQAEVRMHCAKGHDKDVAIRIDLLDAAGQTLLTLNGHGQVEEKDDGTVKIKQRVPDSTIVAAAFFRVEATPTQ